MEVPTDNSTRKSSENLSHPFGEGVVVDIGTGDGRFVYRSALANPNKFFIGIDANARPLEKLSMKATRKPNKGGAPNLLFIQAAIENLPEELNASADEIHIHFPWGSLLQSVICGNENILASLRRICAPECLLEIVFGIDEERDKSEVKRLKLPEISPEYLEQILIPKYRAAGFKILKQGVLDSSRWSLMETSWARKLQSNDQRKCVYIIAQADD